MGLYWICPVCPVILCHSVNLSFCHNSVFFNILRMNGQNLTKFCIHMIIDKIYLGIINRHFSQICKRVTALDWRHNSVFVQYLENVRTEFNQILYTHYHWQDLRWYCKSSFFANLQQRLRPLIDVRIQVFFFQYLENEWTEFNQILYTHDHWQDLRWDYKSSFFRKFATELRPLIDGKNSVFVQYLDNEWIEFNQILYPHYHWQDLRWYR